MKGAKFVTIVSLAMAANVSIASELSDISNLQWKNRVILVDETKHNLNSINYFQNSVSGVAERDVVWFIFQPDGVKTNYTGKVSNDLYMNSKERYGLGKDAVLLIGKDGGVKQRLNKMELKELFGEIDRMPMRQREMRQQGGSDQS
ncbi:DUF4174 domain-containing protein [Vibrio sp.]|nr:DUF4174 domain-containing protein [Vibrio sp.]